jgi:hypothetical protein
MPSLTIHRRRRGRVEIDDVRRVLCDSRCQAEKQQALVLDLRIRRGLTL